jgi:hypothetical protein
MRVISATLLLGLALSNPAYADDERDIHPGRRLRGSVAEAVAWDGTQPFHARGPGALFSSVEAAAVDALSYAHLEARKARDVARIRGGTIHTVGDHYSYGEIQLGKPLIPHQINYRFGPREVARFHVYPVNRDSRINRANERISRVDRRSVSLIDPLHRPLYILHPSLAIRGYFGEDSQQVEVTNLRKREQTPLFAGN